jgi:hypothetical protein
MKKIKHNDLIPWFTWNRADLPASYVKSCEKFFQELGVRAASRKPQAASFKQQAASSKQQATSNKQQATSFKQQA